MPSNVLHVHLQTRKTIEVYKILPTRRKARGTRSMSHVEMGSSCQFWVLPSFFFFLETNWN